MNRATHAQAVVVSAGLCSARVLASVFGALGLTTSAAAMPPDAHIPNDPNIGRNWALEQPNDIDVNAFTAWQMAKSVSAPREVVVAVVDTGMDTAHPDLQQRLWVNPGEVPNDGIDNDGNGYVDDVHGWNFRADQPSVFDQVLSHATVVAGHIAAQTDNGQYSAGTAGTLPVRIMALQTVTLDDLNGITPDALTATRDAVQYAIDNGAHVINISQASTLPADHDMRVAVADMIAAAEAAGILIVNATINADGYEVPPLPDDWIERDPPYYGDGDLSVTPEPFIGTIPSPALLTVGGVDREGALRYAYGAEVHVAAANDDVLNIFPMYDTLRLAQYTSGNSFSTPQVAGIAAMALSVTDLLDRPPAERLSTLRAALIGGVKPLPSLQGKIASGGIIDASRVLELLGFSRPQGPAAAFRYEGMNEPVPGTLRGRAPAAVALTAIDPSWADSQTTSRTFTFSDGTSQSGSSAQKSFSDELGGIYEVQLEAHDAAGNADLSAPLRIEVLPSEDDFVFFSSPDVSVSGKLVAGDLTVSRGCNGSTRVDGQGTVLDESGEQVEVSFQTTYTWLGCGKTGTITLGIATSDTTVTKVIKSVDIQFDAFRNGLSVETADTSLQVVDQASP